MCRFYVKRMFTNEKMGKTNIEYGCTCIPSNAAKYIEIVANNHGSASFSGVRNPAIIRYLCPQLWSSPLLRPEISFHINKWQLQQKGN